MSKVFLKGFIMVPQAELAVVTPTVAIARDS